MSDKRKPIPQGVRFAVLRRDNFACRYCGRTSPAVVLHLDHVKPYSAGGEDTEENLITACEACNYGKGAKTDVTPPVVVPPSDEAGIVGCFGHTYVIAADGLPEIHYQFRVLRQVGQDRFAVQLFSWMFGDPTEIQIWDTDALLAPKAKLFQPLDDAWRRAYDDYLAKNGGRN